MKSLSVILIFLVMLTRGVQAYPVSDHYDGEKFFNPEANVHLTLWDILKWKMEMNAAKWPEHLANKNYPLPVISPTQRAVVTFINHATFLLQLPDLNVLTDPIFSQRPSPIRFMGPKRVREPGVLLEQLPQIDVVVISHNHYDHMDLDSLKNLDAKFHPLFLVPLGDEKLLKEAGIQNVREMDWWQEQVVKEHKIVFTPSQHWSGRGIFDRCKSLWGSYFILSPDFKTYFAGDTGHSSHFSNIKLRLGSPDLALLPIGAYNPTYLMKVSHLSPEEALMAHDDLGSSFSLGMHFGTFQLTDEPIEEPVERLKKAGRENFVVLDQGDSKIF
ncbi:MAG: MBL fold metallo-hydrolase [Leptospira sp.]|nr:MBL fold metallo-hydrolase [Leptospira sp.]